MSEKKSAKGNLSQIKRKPEERGLTMEEVLKHPVVQQMNKKLEDMRELVAGLPEAIGRAVAAAQRANGATLPSGPPVALKESNDGVEFHRKGKIIQQGKEIAPEGPTRGGKDHPRDLEALKSPRTI